MKNYFFLLIIVLLSTPTAAQDFQGKAYYSSKTKINSDFGNNISPERKKRMMERMKASMEKTFELDFNSSASLFSSRNDWRHREKIVALILCLL